MIKLTASNDNLIDLSALDGIPIQDLRDPDPFSDDILKKWIKEGGRRKEMAEKILAGRARRNVESKGAE